MSERTINCPETCPRLKEELNNHCICGKGPKDATIMVVGEQPMSHEDKLGLPFVGRSGQLLEKILEKYGLKPSQIYFTDTIKCSTNRDPPKILDKEIRLCSKYLDKEIAEIKPNIILALGPAALKATLERTGLKKIKNTVFWSKKYNLKVIPTFHPAYILRNPVDVSYLKKAVELLVTEKDTRDIQYKSKIKTTYLVANTPEQIEKTLEHVKTVKEFAFDLETSSLDYLTAKILSISFSWREGFGVTIPWDMITGGLTNKLKAIMYSSILKINHNLKFDIQMLVRRGIQIKGPFWDTMLAHHLLDENTPHGLDVCVLEYTDMGEYWKALEDLKPAICKEKGVPIGQFSYDMFPKEKLYEYAAKDADAAFRLKQIFLEMLEEEELLSLYNNHVLTTMPVLIEMEYRGIKVDREKLKKIEGEKATGLIPEYESKLEIIDTAMHKDDDVLAYSKVRNDELKKELEEKCAEKYNKSAMLKKRYPNGIFEYVAKSKFKEFEFNFASPKQLGALLFEYLKLDPIKETPTGGNSTDEEVLDVLSSNGVKIAKKIVDRRKLAKFISTYLIRTFDASAFDGRFHPDYIQCGTVTGRFASDMQQIPKDAKDFKECFIADPGMIFVHADLKQAEFRCWAHYSNDRDMINDINSGLDIHRKIASEVYGIPESKVTEEQRSRSKGITFGVMFGRGVASVAEEFKISKEEAQTIKNVLFDRYPVAADWLNEQVSIAQATRKVVSWFGRIRRLNQIDSDNQGDRAESERQAKNSSIQGQSSDMNNSYMVESLKRAREQGIVCYPAMMVHDANYIQCKIEQKDQLACIMKEVVETLYPEFRVKMALDFDCGYNLGQLEKFKPGEK